MFVNGPGLLDGLPRNENATEVYQRNVRAQYPDAENPFMAAKKAFEEKIKGAVIINATPENALGYEKDTWIAGDAILFDGYTCDEVDRLAEGAAE